MGVKERSTYNLDSGIVNDFKKICKKRGKKYSEQLEQILEQFIAKDGEMFMDDLYAPRLNDLVKNNVRKEVDRVCGMINNLHVDSNASLIGTFALYKWMQESMETTIESYLRAFLSEDVLKDEKYRIIQRPSESLTYDGDGKEMIQNLRNTSRDDITTRKRLEKQRDGIM
jgi:hypothetical protein